MTNPAIDLNELKEIMDNDMELIQDCFSDFIDDMPQIYEEIKKAVLEKNAQNLDASAHKLKGTLRYLAADMKQRALLTMRFSCITDFSAKIDKL